MDTEPSSRASRRERVRGRGARLRERDLNVLLALAKMRLLRTSDITRLFFEAKGTCQKRLRKLYDAGLIRAVVTDLAAENRYAITRLGHELLQQAVADDSLPPFRAAPRIDGRSVAHLDLLNGYRIAVALGAGLHDLELRSFRPDWELRASDPLATLVPDALILVAKRDSRDGLVLAIEVDTGSEAASIVLKKFIKYRERRALGQRLFGVSPDAVLLLTSTERRARTLARHLVQSGSEGALPPVILGTESTILRDGAVSAGLSLPTELVKDADQRGAFKVGLARLLR